MALWKRGKWYWADFTVDASRYRVPLRDKRGRRIPADESHLQEAIRAEERERMKAESGRLLPAKQSFARLPFNQAADQYLTSRKPELAASSYDKERQLLVKPKEHFRSTPLGRIGPEQVIAYRDWRASQGVGPAIINMELGVLRRILKKAKRWHLIAEDIRPLREPRSIGRALTPEEKTRLLITASQKPEWETACYAVILALNTTMRGCELKGLRWADVNLLDHTIVIRKSKTEAGERLIPLTPEAFDTLLKLHRRAEMFGPVEASHFVFAAFRATFRLKNKAGQRGGTIAGVETWGFDPTRPVASWRTAWRTLRKAAAKGDKAKGVPEMPQLASLRFHDLRHHAITELAESGASEQAIMAIAGHVSRRMLERYSHVRLEAKRQAIQALSRRTSVPVPPGGSQRSHVTNHVTKCEAESSDTPQVIERHGRPVGTRTPDLYRVKVAL